MNLVRGNNYKFQKAHILLGAKNNLLPGNIQSMFSVENKAVIYGVLATSKLLMCVLPENFLVFMSQNLEQVECGDEAVSRHEAIQKQK